MWNIKPSRSQFCAELPCAAITAPSFGGVSQPAFYIGSMEPLLFVKYQSQITRGLLVNGSFGFLLQILKSLVWTWQDYS